MLRLCGPAPLASALLVAFISCNLACRAERSSDAASAEAPPARSRSATPEELVEALPWFEGGVEAAFAAAEREKKPVFLYWGAVWCPPCAEIKRHVFTHPRFAPLVRQVVAVYLDGDTPEAQTWGETFGANGYPTLLLLSADRTELMRFSGITDFSEFADAFESAVAANRPVAETLRLALDGRASTEDWRLLAQLSWMQSPRIELEGEARAAAQKKLADSVPAALETERALLAGGLLAEAATGDPELATLQAVRAEPMPYIDRLIAGGTASFAARGYVIDGAVPILSLVAGAERSRAAARWFDVLRELPRHPRAPADLELEARLTELEIARLLDPEAKPSPEQLEGARAAVRAADARAKSRYDRHAVISTAARLLSRVGAVDEAKVLLRAEIERTDTPWYYQSSMSQLAHETGADAEALRWAALAAQSARGRATRIQWTVRHLVTAVEVGADDEVAAILDAYYGLAFEMPDGFAGRNWRRARTVADAVRSLGLRADVRTVLERRAASCSELTPNRRDRCRAHFASARG